MRLRNVVFSLLWGAAGLVSAQTSPDSSVLSRLDETEFDPSVYERRKVKRIHRWERLIPSHYKVQFAGSIGMFSIGPGWTYGRSNQWETDLMFGFLPKFESDEMKLVFTIRESYVPWNLQIGHSDYAFKPLTCGLFLSSVLNHDFWVSEPGRYPGGYYGFSTRIRSNLFLGQRITYYRPEAKRTFAQGLSLYYELSVCDTDLLTFFGDKCIKFKEILSLALGLKLHL